jgi:hypothetical protein
MIENQAARLFSIKKPCDSVVIAACDCLVQGGMRVIQSFDLQLARANQGPCSCPYHGTELCDCQMIVLLIYSVQDIPVTLVCHGHDGWTHLSLVDNPGQKVSQESVSIIKEILSPLKLILSEH